MNPGLHITDNIADFGIMLLAGIAVSALFDLFRAMRKALSDNGGKNPNALVQLQDLLFAMSSFLFVLLLIYRINDGVIRSYIVIGLITGMLLYAAALGKVSNRLFYYVFYALFAACKYIIKALKFIFVKPAGLIKDFSGRIVNDVKAKKLQKTCEKEQKA